MPEHRFSLSDSTIFLEISELLFRHCKAGENVTIEIPMKGCAASLAAWHTEQKRLFLKMPQTPRIHISVNQSGVDEVIVRIESEVVMNRTIIQNFLERISPIERIRQWIPAAESDDTTKNTEQRDPAAPLNILYSALKDSLVADNLDIRSLDSGSDLTNTIKAVRIWPQTENAEQFILKNSRYGSALETGIRRFIQNGSGNWPLLKAAPDMLIEVNVSRHPEKDVQTEFYIELDWPNTATTSGQIPTHSAVRIISSSTAIGKKRLTHPLTITLDCGSSPSTHEITHVPYRINGLSGDWSELSLSDCKYVSKNHLVLDLVQGQLVLIEQGSSHGTFTADGQDLRKLPGRQYPIPLNSSNEIFLCFGSTEQQIRSNRHSGDRKKFPRLVINFGKTTPEICGYEGTPELEDAVNC